jgi:CDP-diacylglycerol--serine O-phosphatidyltransferase
VTSPARCLHHSNLFTYLSLLAALGAIAAASRGSAAGAGILVALAALADTFDGKFARLFARDREMAAFGGQLDSLSDAIAFGMAPAICAFLLSPPNHGTLTEVFWWAAAFAFAASAITRLGYYNIASDRTAGFIGLPVPAAALIWSSVLLTTPSPATVAVMFTATATAMIAPLPVPRPVGTGLAAFAMWPILVIGAHVTRL